MTRTNTNPYIEQGILDDCDNDFNIVSHIRTLVNEGIHYCKKHKDMGALAYNDHLFDDVINKLDSILADHVSPVQNQIEEGFTHHER